MGKLLEQPTPVIGDDGSRLAVLLVGVVASVEEAAPVVGGYVGSDGSRPGRNGDTGGGLLCVYWEPILLLYPKSIR